MVFKQIQWTEIHWDFILDKANLTPTELQNRFVALNGRVGLSKDDSSGGNLPQPAEGTTPMADFACRVDNMRRFICALARPRLNKAFIVRAKAMNLGYDCVTLEDYLREIRTGPYDNKKRKLVYELCNNLWGKETSMDIEKMVMKKLRLKYKNELVDGKDRIPKTRRTSGSIRKMINRMKQTNYVERFRYVFDHHALCVNPLTQPVLFQRCLQAGMERNPIRPGTQSPTKRCCQSYQGTVFTAWVRGLPGTL